MEMRYEEQINYYLKNKRLKFSKSLEKQYFGVYNNESIPIVRIALVLGIALYSLFGILDIFIAPLSRNTIWIIRFTIVVPTLVIGLILTLFSFFTKIMHVTMSIIALSAGFGIIWMIAILKDSNGAHYYYAGLILVIMWSYTFIRLPFVNASISCGLLVVGYQATAIFIQNMLSSPATIKVYINNNFFFLSAYVMGMFINYLFELSSRRNFLQGLIINEKQSLLQIETEKLVKRNKIMKDELEIARTIQQHLIPDNNPSELISSLYKPMEEVGGDLFDFIDFPDKKKIGLFLSDVSGHGVPAAFITSMVKSIIIQSRYLIDNPAKLLNHLNDLLIEETGSYFITVFYCIFDFKKRTLIYANAGHNPPYLCYHNKIKMIDQKVHFIPVAVMDTIVYRNFKVTLPADSKLILYTDGLVEASNSEQKEDTFDDIIKDHIINLKHLSPKEFISALYKQLVIFRGKEEFDDDICLICLDVK